MFKIYGGANKFKQWTQDNKLIMDELPIGADVMFYNDPNEDDPLITEVYEIRDEEDNVFRVCDVPNILLTKTENIKVRIPKVAKGLYGNLYKVAGRNEMIFEVESAEKPSDYVYEKTVTNTIDPKRLPEGYPYKEEKAFEDIIWDGNTEGRTFISFDGGVFCKVGKPIEMDKIIGAKSVFRNTLQNQDLEVEVKENAVVRISDETYMANDTSFICAFRSISIEGIEINEPGMYFASGSGGYVSGLYAPETIHPIAAEFLPTSVPAIESASVGQVPKVAAVDENGVPTKWEAGEAKSYSEESWTFTLEDGGTVTKKVAVGE